MALQERTRAITLEVILRAVFGVEAERMEQLREAVGALFAPLTLPMLLRMALSRPTLERPKGGFGRALDRLDGVIYAELAPARARGPRGAHRHPFAVDAGARRAGRGDERRRTARRAGDAAAGRPRDDRDLGGVGDRAPGAPPRQAGAADRGDRRRRERGVHAGRHPRDDARAPRRAARDQSPARSRCASASTSCRRGRAWRRRSG